MVSEALSAAEGPTRTIAETFASPGMQKGFSSRRLSMSNLQLNPIGVLRLGRAPSLSMTA
jgi:hypothetical protein